MQNPNEPPPDSYRVDSSSNPSYDSDHDLYTIPSYSSWFAWDDIHHNEKTAHNEFFNNATISKTPKIYKEYRDFIINKYREDPSRRLTFTDVRKSLTGDVGSIHKIFRFLENWGLINFGAHQLDGDRDPATEDEAGQCQPKVVVEEGAPSGIRVVEYPNSTKVLAGAMTEGGERGCEEAGQGGGGGGGFWLPPLTSYSDMFREVGRKKGCWNCGMDCVSGYYESVKGGSVICAKCFKNENYEESKLADDFKFTDVGTGNFGTDVWTDTETVLLLEAVSKHGDDWNLVEQHVRTKTKLDCISRLIQLPFGENMLHTTIVKGDDRNTISHTSGVEMEIASAAEPQEPLKTEDQHHECMGEAGTTGQMKNSDTAGPPVKRRCVTSFTDASSPLMKQVALLSTIVGPHVAAAAAEAAVAALCNENPCATKFYEAKEEDDVTYDLGFPTVNNETIRIIKGEDTEMEVKRKRSDDATPEKSTGPSTLQIRVAIATALGAAAAHAKLLADQEEREIEHLMATIIETQLRKIQCKIKHFEELELIMEKEYSQIQQLKESILADRIDVLQQALNAGISRWKDHNFKSSITHLL